MNEKFKDSEGTHQASFFNALKRYFFTGLATAFPLFITLYIVILIFSFFDHLAGKYINSFLMRNYGFMIPGLGLFVTAAVVVLIGVFSAHFIGKGFYRFLERVLLKIPLLAGIYPPAKQLSDFLFRREKEKNLKKVVLVEYPYPGTYSIGFITNENIDAVEEKVPGKLVGIFVPFAFSPFSGFILFTPREKVVELEISIDEALKFIISGGLVTPRRKKDNQKSPDNKFN